MTTFDKKYSTLERIMDEFSDSVRAAVVAIVSTTPSGMLRVLHVSGTNDFLRAFDQSGHAEVRAVWQALLNNKCARDHASDESSWLARNGLEYAVATPVSDMLFAGYPSTLVAYRARGEAAFTPQEEEALRNAAQEISSLFAPASSNHATARRYFVVNQKGEFVGISPAASQLDDATAERLASLARKLSADKSELLRKDAGNRVLIADSTGDTTPWRVIRQKMIPAIGNEPFLVLAQVPKWQEWNALVSNDFAALPEIGLLLPAINLMAARFADDIVLTDIAQAVHLSQYHFHRRFTDLLGITPKHYLYDRQIDYAKELLLDGKTSLADIARICGFAHQSHFTSRFRQSTGSTPTRWRKMKLNLQRRLSGMTHEHKPTLQSRAG